MLRGILFDMDGVLVDSIPSIHACLNHALDRMGRAPIGREAALPAVGPPLEHAAEELLGTRDAAEVERFVGHYRERYGRTCARETLPAAGLAEVLAALAARWPLAVATSKPEVYAREILGALGVAGRFAAICGRSLALDRATKAASIARAVEAVAEDGSSRGLIMVGDRSHDVEGAAEHGIPTVGVLHGAGSEAELRGAGARWILDDLRGLPALTAELAERAEPL